MSSHAQVLAKASPRTLSPGMLPPPFQPHIILKAQQLIHLQQTSILPHQRCSVPNSLLTILLPWLCGVALAIPLPGS